MRFALFNKKAEKSATIPPPTDELARKNLAISVEAQCRRAYVQFLNDYVAHGFAEEEGEKEVQGHFYAQALAIAPFLAAIAPPGTLELAASHVTEQQRQKARRNYRELRETAAAVLIDQRNYLLASHINGRAAEMGLRPQNGVPFSGMETENGQPCHAFALKLMADSSLSRGPASGLKEEAVTMLEHHIARQAETDIAGFLQLYAREHENL